MQKLFKQKLKTLISKFGSYFNKDLIELNSPVGMYRRDAIQSSYNYFKKYFVSSVLFSNVEGIRDYCINQVLRNLKKEDLILEFGVYKGESINFFSEIVLKHGLKNSIYGFDSFQGLSDDWKGNIDHPKKSLNLNNKLPKVRSNINLIQGKVEKTIDKFLDNTNGNIIFVHFDLDLYSPTKYVLEKIKSRLSKECVMLFDQMYGYPGWEQHEFKAFNEVFSNEAFKYIAFGPRQIGIQIN